MLSPFFACLCTVEGRELLGGGTSPHRMIERAFVGIRGMTDCFGPGVRVEGSVAEAPLGPVQYLEAKVRQQEAAPKRGM
jgi:hypothetical protein